MSDRARTSVTITTFDGVDLGVDQFDPGDANTAADQVNIQSTEPGRLIVRMGCRTVSFDAGG